MQWEAHPFDKLQPALVDPDALPDPE
jgi:hypothetical protein